MTGWFLVMRYVYDILSCVVSRFWLLCIDLAYIRSSHISVGSDFLVLCSIVEGSNIPAIAIDFTVVWSVRPSHSWTLLKLLAMAYSGAFAPYCWKKIFFKCTKLAAERRPFLQHLWFLGKIELMTTHNLHRKFAAVCEISVGNCWKISTFCSPFS